MKFESWRWYVERDLSDSPALGFGWYETVGKHRHQPYPKSGARVGDDDSLRLTLQTDSLTSALSDDGTDRLSALLQFIRNRSDLVTAARTPSTTSHAIPKLLADVECFEYGELHNGGIWREVTVDGVYTSVPERQIDEFQLRRAVGAPLTDAEVAEVRSVWRDIEAHKAYHGDIFVTGTEALLNYGDGIGHEARVWILDVDQTLGYFETIAKGRGVYFFNPWVRTDRWSYYSERTQREATALLAFNRCVRSGGWQHNAKADLSEYIHSLETRLRYLMEVRDQVGYIYYTSAGINENDAVLYHMNHFFLLTTAIFDNLAWVLNHFYRLRLAREKTVLWNPKLRDSAPSRFRSLIDSRLSLMNIFIEPRHSVAHRQVMRGIGFRDTNTDAGANLVEIDESMAKAIGQHDSPAIGAPYTAWGVARPGSVVLLEPYRFCTAAIREVLRFVDDFFELLCQEAECHRWQPSDPELDLRRQRRQFAIPFITPII